MLVRGSRNKFGLYHIGVVYTHRTRVYWSHHYRLADINLPSDTFPLQTCLVECGSRLLYLIRMVGLLQANVSIKRIGAFLQNKNLDDGNVIRTNVSEQTGNSSVDFIKNIATLFVTCILLL